MEHYRFVTSFDHRLLNDVSSTIASPYSNIWSAEEKTDYDTEVEGTLGEVGKGIGRLLQDHTDIAQCINLIGEQGTGKTRVLKLLARTLWIAGSVPPYNTMQDYINVEPSDVVRRLRTTRGTGVLLLDEANYVTPQLHEELSQTHRAIVYASHQPLEFVEGARRIYLEKKEF